SPIESAPVAGARSQAARGGAADPSAPAAGPPRAAGLDDGLEAPQVPLDASPEGAEAGAGPLREPLRIDLQPDGDARRGRVQAAEGHHPRVGRALQRRPGPKPRAGGGFGVIRLLPGKGPAPSDGLRTRRPSLRRETSAWRRRSPARVSTTDKQRTCWRR